MQSEIIQAHLLLRYIVLRAHKEKVCRERERERQMNTLKRDLLLSRITAAMG